MQLSMRGLPSKDTMSVSLIVDIYIYIYIIFNYSTGEAQPRLPCTTNKKVDSELFESHIWNGRGRVGPNFST